MNKTEVERKLKDNELPKRWTKIRLGEIIIENTKSRFKVENADNSGRHPFFTSGEVILSDSNYLVDYENIFLATGGVANIKYYKGKANYSADTYCLKAKITTKYLYYFLLKNLMKVDYKYFSGSGLKHLQKSDFKKDILILPSLPCEQQKIVEILETVDETIEKTGAIIEKYKRIKQGLMQDLLTRGITAFEFEKDKLIVAVKKVFDSGDHRFGREENLVNHLSSHLSELFLGWNVDSEVEKNNKRQRPDIIIHKRGTDKNLFAIEVKKNDNLNAIKEDIKKLEDVMLGDYQYEDAVFIGFNIESFEDIFKLSEKVNFILVSKNGEIKVKPHVREFKDSPLGRIPEDWDAVNIKDICKVRQGLQIAIANRFKESRSKRYIYITIQYLNSEKKDKDAEYIQNPPKSVLCGENDLLMTRTGNTGMVITDVEGVFHNNFFLVDYYKKQVNKIYLFYYLNLPWIQEEVKALAGTTTIPDLNHGDFYSLKFLKPSLLEQQRIASILSQTDETIEKEQKYKHKLERIKQGLMEDLLTGKVRVNHLIKEGIESV